jgi:hypothetical protein
MDIKIICNEELVKNPAKWLLKNMELMEEGQKMFVRYPIDRAKELRIFFKNTLLEPEKREHIKKVWTTGEGIEDLLNSFWIVKSSSSGVLLFVPYETEASDKSGVFVLTVSKSYFYPSPLHFKRSHITGQAISLFYSLPKSIIFLLGESTINLVYNNANAISLKKYVEAESVGK